MQRSRKIEVIVGVFVLISLAVFFAMTFVIRGNTGLNPYVIRMEFPNVAGLEIGSPVLVQGFRLGRVTGMEPHIGEDKVPRVIVITKIANDIPIYKNAKGFLVQQGFIGDKRIEIDPGTADAGEIETGEMIEGVPPADITAVFASAQDIVKDLGVTIANLRQLTSDPERIGRIDDTIRQVNESTARLNKILEENQPEIAEATKNLKELSSKSLQVADRADEVLQATNKNIDDVSARVTDAIAQFREDAREVTTRVNRLLDETQGVGDNANELLATSREEIRLLSESLRRTSDSLNTLLSSVNQGQGTVGQLFQDPGPFEDLSASVSALRNVLDAEQRRDYVRRRIEYRQPGAAATEAEPAIP